ncbi:MAG: hypothetical protein WCR04_02285 [Fibrobacteraceae bacterium]
MKWLSAGNQAKAMPNAEDSPISKRFRQILLFEKRLSNHFIKYFYKVELIL